MDHQQAVNPSPLGVKGEAASPMVDADWWWSGHENDPVVALERITVAGAHMLIQTTKSGLMLLNGKVVEPAAKAAK